MSRYVYKLDHLFKTISVLNTVLVVDQMWLFCVCICTRSVKSLAIVNTSHVHETASSLVKSLAGWKGGDSLSFFLTKKASAALVH